MKKTLENLARAFAWESQARNRYTIYASVARKADAIICRKRMSRDAIRWYRNDHYD